MCKRYYISLISLLLIAITSCSKVELEQEDLYLRNKDSYTRAENVECTIDVEESGTLQSIVEDKGYSDIQKLIITGSVSMGDISYVCKNMTSVEILDLSKAICSTTTWGNIPSNNIKDISLPKNIISIASYAFENCNSLSMITIPESVTNIGNNAFYGCNTLQKVVCYSPCDLGDFNSNKCWLILYSSNDQTASYGPNWPFVVVDGVAENVNLSYHGCLEFTIPEEVNLIKKISYTMRFRWESWISTCGIWRTIAIPFAPTSITHAEKGTLAPFDSGVKGAKNFWLRELTKDGFKDVTQIEANRPYLIAMPYSKEYIDDCNLNGYVTFSTENLIPKDVGYATPLSAEGTDYTMYATYSFYYWSTGRYALNDSCQFDANWETYPFEAYLKSNTATRSVISFVNGFTTTRTASDVKREPRIDDM